MENLLIVHILVLTETLLLSFSVSKKLYIDFVLKLTHFLVVVQD